MKKILALVLSVIMLLSLGACGDGRGTATNAPTTNVPESSAPETNDPDNSPDVTEPGDSEGFEIALITDIGGIDDGSFNEGSWNGVVAFTEREGISRTYFYPYEDSDAGRMENIAAAVEKGAKVIICPGFLFSESIFKAQTMYPDVQFLLLDTEPADPDDPYSGENVATANTHSIYYREEQSGFLAGYAAVMDGYRNLGYLGGMAMPPVVRFGYGYVQGAEAAAKELGLAAGDVIINYWYSETFDPSDDISTKMNSWYSSGTEVVFACGGGIYLSCLAAAETNNAKLIGVDVDQGHVSPLIITSAMKELANSVDIALTALYENGGTWDSSRAGQAATLGINEDCVGLPTNPESWRLENWTVEEYEKIEQAMKDGDIVVSDDDANAPVVELVVVNYQY